MELRAGGALAGDPGFLRGRARAAAARRGDVRCFFLMPCEILWIGVSPATCWLKHGRPKLVLQIA